MAIAVAADVQKRLGRELTTEETTLVTERLADAERKIKRKIPDLQARADADAEYKATVVQVESDAVLRLVRNPEGFLSEGDGGYQYMLSREAASGRLEILDEEWEDLGYVRRGMAIIVPTPVMPT